MVEVAHIWVAGEAPLHVDFDADQVAHQTLNVEPVHDRQVPSVVVQSAKHPVEGIRRAAERLGGGDVGDVGVGAPGRARVLRGLQHTLAQVGEPHGG